jgi:hypothetical protein
MIRIVAALGLFLSAAAGALLVLADLAGWRADVGSTAPADSRDALLEQPTSADPLARAAAQSGNRGRMAQLADAAIRRDPRSVTPWYLRLRMAAEANDARGVAFATLRLLAINPSRSDRYLPVLVSVTGDPAAQPLILEALRTKPGWTRRYSQAMLAQGAAPATIFRTIQAQVAALDPRAGSAQAGFLQDMVRQGRFDQAYLAWINFLPETALGDVGLVYDPDFRGRVGPPPFNWTFAGGDNRAQLRTGGGLTVNYSNEQRNRIAEQIVMMPPGAYRLSTDLQMTAAPDQGALEWRITCLPGGRPLIRLLLDRSGKLTSPAFTVPAGCGAQRLALMGLQQQFPVSGEITMASVAIGRVGGGQ